MNATQQGVITLLKSAIIQQALPLPAEFDMSVLAKLINRHQMAALIYDGAARCGVDPNNPVMKSLFPVYCRVTQISERQMALFHSVCQEFDAAQIDYMPLKGCRMKMLYPKPELRTMADADMLIRLDQYDRIRPIMERLGFRHTKETDHELIWDAPGLQVELHKRLVPSYNKDFFAYYGEGWQFAKVNNGTCYAMTKEDQMVYLFTHFAKHFRDGGIGCRYVVDLWVFRRENPNLDEAYIEAELEKLQLKQFYHNVLRLIDCWFADGEVDPIMEEMTEYIFVSGSWGKMEKRIAAAMLRESKQSKLRLGSKLVYLRRLAFPSVEAIRDKYKILKKAPWLLPVVWLIRPFYKILFERKSLKNRKREYNALNQDSLQQQQMFLNRMGLDYHF